MLTESSPVEKKRALVIAVSEYDNLQKLSVCERDGKEVSKLLEKNGYSIAKNHRLIGRVNHSTLRDTVYDFFHDSNITPEDTILFYFSGHGIPGDDGEHYFASSEINPDGPRRRGLSFDEYTDFMSDCNSKVIFSILDCCYSGAVKPSKGNKNVESKKGESIIKEKLEGKGKCTLSSCKPMQKSYLLKRNSVFTTFLLEGLVGGQGRSADDKGCITPELLLDYIDWKIRSMSADERRREQTPFLKCERSGGKIILSQFEKFSKVKVSQPEEARNTEYYLQQGNNSLYKGEYKNAIKEYDKIISDPNYVTAIYNKGLVLDKLGKYRQAITFYKRVLDIRSRYFDAVFAMGYTLSNLGKIEEAITWYDNALRIRPNDSDSLYNKALLLNNLNKYEEALTWYDKALKINPKDRDTLHNKGQVLYNMHRYQPAITWYDKALKIDPEDTDALYNKALALDDLGKYQQAITWYDRALKINPLDSNAINNKGLALFNLGKYQQAIAWYDKALKIDPKHVDSLYNKALALYAMGKYQQALAWYDRALKINPKHAGSLYNKALALYAMGKYQQAIAWYDKALKIDPEDSDALYNKALALDELGKYQQAIAWYDKALKISPEDKEIMKRKTILRKKLERKRKT